MLNNLIEETLIQEQKAFLPSEEEILQYEERGWFASKTIIPEKLIDEAIKGVHEFYKGKRDFKLSNSEGIADDDINEKDTFIRNNEFVTLQKKELQELGFYPVIAAVAARLARTSSIRLFADSLICKYPSKSTDQGVVGWHTDKAYWPTCTSDKMLTAWIPLQDCTVEMGTLLHIEGSHKWKEELALKSYYSFNNQDLKNFELYLSREKPTHIKRSMLLKKGQVSFHNCHTIHSSSPNKSEVPRMALALHLQDEENRYQKAYKPTGETISIGYDKMCGKDEFSNPNYSDSSIFPVLWQQS